MHIVSSSALNDDQRAILGLIPETILEAMPGVCYITSPDGLILSVAGRMLSQPSCETGTPRNNVEQFTGAHILSQMGSKRVRRIFDTIYKQLRDGTREAVRFDYRCDTPETERRLSMRITPILKNGEVIGLLHLNLLVYERTRKPMSVFEPDRRIENAPVRATRLQAKICSFCHDVAYPLSDNTEHWMPLETFSTYDGTENVFVSFCACLRCQKFFDDADTPEFRARAMIGLPTPHRSDRGTTRNNGRLS